jgi:hypothetical protein
MLKNERDEMKESLLDLKCRSIKYNLVFTGLREASHENTEETLVFSPNYWFPFILFYVLHNTFAGLGFVSGPFI